MLERGFLPMNTAHALPPFPGQSTLRGCVNDERDDEAPTSAQRRADGLAALQLMLEDMPAGTMLEAQHLGAILGAILPLA